MLENFKKAIFRVLCCALIGGVKWQSQTLKSFLIWA